MRKPAILVISTVCMIEAASATMVESGQKLAVILSLLSILISLPAFFAVYVQIRRTNLGKVLFQPLLAMFVGFIGIMINSLIQIWQVFKGFEVSNRDLLIGINSAISTILIAIGAIIMFFAVKNKGLFPIEYYQHKTELSRPAEPKPAEPVKPEPVKDTAVAEAQFNKTVKKKRSVSRRIP